MSALPIKGQAPRLRAWQAAALPLVGDALARGVSGVVVACTGSGKSILLAEVIADQLARLAGTVVVATSSTRLVNQLAGTIGVRVGHAIVGRYFGDAKQPGRRVVVTTYQSLGALADALGVDAGLLVCDECHRTETEQLHDAVTRLGGLRVGFTATPFRSHKDQRLRLWDEVLVRYTPGDALRDGVICPWQSWQWTGGKVDLDEAIIEMIKRTTGPGAVNARSISDAVAFAERLTGEGIPAAAVHSGLSDRDQEARLRMLRDGELRCVVYPSLLAEGADFPWLRWMGLRRKVGARVRFIQEVGRVLRTAPGKDVAIILDPQDLFNELSLTYSEVLGWQDDPDTTSGDDNEKADDEEEDEDGPVKRRTVSGVNVVVSWARQLYLAAEAESIAKHKVALNPSVRERLATAGQIDTLMRMRHVAARTLPPEHDAVYQRLVLERAVPSMGAASDLIELIIGLNRREHQTKERWRPILPVLAPDAEVLQRLDVEMTGSWYTAGVVAHGMRAVAIVCGRRTIKSEVRADDGKRLSPVQVAAAAAVIAAELAGDDATVHLDHEMAHALLTDARHAWSDDLRDLLAQRPDRARFELVREGDNPARKVAWAAIGRRRRKAPSTTQRSA